MEKQFEFKEIDQEGLETLSAIEQAEKFNRWMFETIKPFCQNKVLEIGSGIGNISNFFIEEGYDITLSDIRQNYCDRLVSKFTSKVRPEKIIKFDLTDPAFDTTMKQHLGMYDTVFALNVVEHIEDHELAMKNCHKLLRKGGKAIILVPAYQFLYNRFDAELEHYRRYTKKSLSDIFTKADFLIVKKFHFNFMGIPGWYFSGKLQGNKTIPGGQMKLYNALVPIFRLVDAVLLRSIGLSVVVVGEKK